MTATVLQLLEIARALIDAPEKHCVKHFAETAAGVWCNTYSAEACRFCAVGALMRAAHDMGTNSVEPLRGWEVYARTCLLLTGCLKASLPEDFLRQGIPESPTSINDFAGHAVVMAGYDLAITQAKAGDA